MREAINRIKHIYFLLLLLLISSFDVLGQTDLKNNSNTIITNPANTVPNLSTAPSNTINPTRPDSTKSVTIDSLDNEQDIEPLEHRIVYNARDSIRYETKGQKIYLFGDAFVEYEDMNLKSEFIEIDNEKNTITAYGKTDSLGKQTGNPLFKDGAQEIACRKMIYNLKTKKGKIYDVLTKEGELILMGSEVKKDSNNVVYMKNLKCIPCEFEDSRTIFKAKKAKIIPNDKIVTGPMYLEIAGVPTPLGLPFGFFPNTKRSHSGIIIPEFKNSAQLGFGLVNGGFYWGINDRTDMTINGDIYTNGSFSLRSTNAYKVNYKFNGALSLSYSEFKSGEREIPTSFTTQKNMAIKWRHIQDQKSNPSIQFSSDVNVVTSKQNRFNAQNTGQYLTNTFQSNISFSKMFKIGVLGLNARHDQNTQTNIMNISFPELTFNVTRFYPFKKETRIKQNPIDKIGISYSLIGRNTLSGIDSTIFKGNIGDSIKYGIEHRLPLSTNINLFKYFTLSPSINLSAVMLTKTTRKELDYTTNKVIRSTDRNFTTGYDANFSTALTTKVYMDYLFKSKLLKQIRHSLIPTVTYVYRPDFGETQYGFWKEYITDTINKYKARYSIFENTLFSGPAVGTQNSLGFNLNNTIEAKIRNRTDTGFVYNKVSPLQNLGINGAYNFAADSFNMTNISISARTKLLKYFDVVINSNFDPYYTTIVTNEITSKEFEYRTKDFLMDANGRIADFKSGNLAVTANFSSNLLASITKRPSLTNGVEKGVEKNNNIKPTERLPWNLYVSYNLIYNKVLNKLKDVQTINFSGDISITKFWKLGATSGYDFTNRNLSFTRFTVQRDLHCWQAGIDWIPFGPIKSYMITINLKSSMLSDAIKTTRQRQWFDNK